MTHPTTSVRGAIAALFVVTLMATEIDAEDDCGIWLGPSPIKESEAHGWGHSIFTGKMIPKGSIVLGSGLMSDDTKQKVGGDLFVPVYDWESFDMATMASWDDDEFTGDDDNLVDRRKDELTRRQEQLEAWAKNGDQDPPLFHQLWNGDIYSHEVLESEESMRAFIPGLSTICPCTYRGFNLEQIKRVAYRDWRDLNDIGHDESPPSPQAGSFTYLSNAMFKAARDIMPGEELVVECADNSDHFDPSKYPPVKFTPKEAGGYSICLDDKVEERNADHTANVIAEKGGQRGLFAKRNLKQGEILTSTPMIPVHKEEMTMDREKYAAMLEDAEAQENIEKIGIPPKKKQLLTNYLYGHKESSLLWLATAPLLHAVNHAPHDKDVQPNAKLQWHHDKYTDAQAAGTPLSRRQQFHHAELLEMDSLEVVRKHGMGLMVDLVALRDIREGEEILIDYGKAWDDAWKKHNDLWKTTIDAIKKGHADEKAEWKRQRKRERESRDRQTKLDTAGRVDRVERKHKQRHVENSMTAIPLSSYVTASDFNHFHKDDDIRTLSEQRRNPYPSNIETACYFETDWLDDGIVKDEDADEITSESWYEQLDHYDCLLPCIITERREYVDGEEADILGMWDDDFNEVSPNAGKPNGGSRTNKRYVAKLVDSYEHNSSIRYECHIYNRFEYYYMDIPREGITFVDKAHSTDQWIDQAFRHPIGFPDGMYPSNWKDLSRRKGTRGGHRKKEISSPIKEMTVEEATKEKAYQFSVKKWNEAESRREMIEELQEDKHRTKNSPRYDL